MSLAVYLFDKSAMISVAFSIRICIESFQCQLVWSSAFQKGVAFRQNIKSEYIWMFVIIVCYYSVFHSCCYEVYNKIIALLKTNSINLFKRIHSNWKSPTHSSKTCIFIVFFFSLRQKKIKKCWAGCFSCCFPYNKSWWWFILPSLKSDKKHLKISPRRHVKPCLCPDGEDYLE